MTLYQEVPGPFLIWKGGPAGPNKVLLSRDIEKVWSAPELEAIGLWRDDMIAPAGEVPAGGRIVAKEVRRIEGVVRYAYVMEEMSLDDLKAEKLQHLADRRWEIETGGIVVGELSVDSGRDTQDRVDQIVKAYDDGDISGTVLFKLAPGIHVEIDVETLRAIKRAGAQHIQACFRREGELAAAILAANDLAALESIDVQGFWA